jgi:hypothetical protein
MLMLSVAIDGGVCAVTGGAGFHAHPGNVSPLFGQVALQSFV